MKFLKSTLTIMLLALLGTGCSQESKVKSAVQSQFKAEFVAQVNKEFKSTESSKIWTEFKDWVVSNTSAEVTEVNINGDEADGKMKVTTLNKDVINGLSMLLLFGAAEADKKGMSLKDLWSEIQKKDKRTPAMSEVPKQEVQFTFKAKKDGDWKITESKEQKPPKKK
ncbi:MAG: hypothetical protein ACLGGX_05680 [Bdellovibrionia bacterium]